MAPSACAKSNLLALGRRHTIPQHTTHGNSATRPSWSSWLFTVLSHTHHIAFIVHVLKVQSIGHIHHASNCETDDIVLNGRALVRHHPRRPCDSTTRQTGPIAPNNFRQTHTAPTSTCSGYQFGTTASRM